MFYKTEHVRWAELTATDTPLFFANCLTFIRVYSGKKNDAILGITMEVHNRVVK